MAGIVGVSAVGMLLDATGSWDAALFLPSMALMVAGSVCFTLLGRNEPIDFDAQDNSPLGVERWLEGPRAAAARSFKLQMLPPACCGGLAAILVAHCALTTWMKRVDIRHHGGQ